MPTYRDQYLALSAERDKAFQAARDARDVCTRAFLASRAGNGDGPTMDQMNVADDKEALVEKLNAEVDATIKKALGWG